MTPLHPPSYLAHFTSADTALRRILPSGELLMNPYRLMRDPLENNTLIPHMVSTAPPWPEGEVHPSAWYDAFEAALRSIRSQYRLISFSRADAYCNTHDQWVYRAPWQSGRLWESYGDKHAGVCLLFRRDALLASLESELGKRGYCSHGEVDYTPGGFAESRAAWPTLSCDPKTAVATAKHYVATYLPELFFLKTTDWASECEYRLIFNPAFPITERQPVYVCVGDSLEHVIVGDRFPFGQLGDAYETATSARAALWRMHWLSGSPSAVKADDAWWIVQDKVHGRA